MRLLTVLTLLLAAGLATLAGVMAMNWLEEQKRLNQSGPAVAKQEPKGTIVVATKRMGFGVELSGANVREIPWQAGNLPNGAFATMRDMFKDGQKRVVLSGIEINEPILRWKITGEGQRASLSALLKRGMKAVTIKVNDVVGIAGFVLPGDRVDVMLTRNSPAGQGLVNEVLLQDVKILAIDQIADERLDKARPARLFTVEVSMKDAQRIVLAKRVGALSLALRGAGETGSMRTGALTPAELTGDNAAADVFSPPLAPQKEPVRDLPETRSGSNQTDSVPVRSRLKSIGVTRSVNRTIYNVPGKTSNQEQADQTVRPRERAPLTPIDPGRTNAGREAPNQNDRSSQASELPGWNTIVRPVEKRRAVVR